MESLPIIPTEFQSPQTGPNSSGSTGNKANGEFSTFLSAARQQQDSRNRTHIKIHRQTGAEGGNEALSSARDDFAPASMTVLTEGSSHPTLTDETVQAQLIQLLSDPAIQDGWVITQTGTTPMDGNLEFSLPDSDETITLSQLFPRNNLVQDLTVQDRKTIITGLLDAIANRVDNDSLQDVRQPAPLTKPILDLLTAQQNPSATSGLSTETTEPLHFRRDLTIENWSATFSSQDWVGKSITITSQGKGTAPPEAALFQAQENQSHLIAVSLTQEGEEATLAVGANNSGNHVPVTQGRQDVTNQYIHSNLPNNALNEEEGNAGNNASGNREQSPGKDDALLATQRSGQHSKTMDGSSLFSLDLQNPQSTGSATQTSGTYGLRYIPGFELQEHQIINQVIERFSMNRRLETGTVTLRLQPAELGNLKLEIQVERDSITAHIVAANPQVKDVLERHIPKLREALTQQGLQLEHLEVTVAAGDKDNTQLFKDQARDQRFPNHQIHTVHAVNNTEPTQEFELAQEPTPLQALNFHA